MTSDEQPTVGAGMDPLGHIVLTVRGDGNSSAPDYELPPTVPLATAARILDMDPADALVRAREGLFPERVIDVGDEPGVKFSVPVAPLIRRVGLDRVREALRVKG
ncbi:hypothetical protein [Streptomyces spectabilis]|uniref:Uncharacterized protein n=1 Tax=Streptomyces spectabilis TaxID=68270 RepID=A0A516R9Y7_STRST|nr:hypothetical protein [Streptomyces spectabilis]QDQ12480.1 hypothetical protein FH965_19540 [Streptomyces spectabilis]